MSEFERVFRENRDYVFKYLMKLSRNAAVAEELTQETFFRAYMNYSALRDYLNKYCKELSSEAPMQYCANGAVNAIITSFAEQAADCNVKFTVKADIPDGIGIEVTDLSVLFGNLLENAIEACKCDNGDKQKKIVLRAKTDNNSLCITVETHFRGCCGAQIAECSFPQSMRAAVSAPNP